MDEAKAALSSTPANSAASVAGVDPVVVGTWLAVASALFYTGANIALREAAISDEPDWALWVSCLKAIPTMLLAAALVAWRYWNGSRLLPPPRLVGRLLLAGLFMQFGGNVSFQWALSLGGLGLTVPMCLASLIVSGAILGRIYLLEPVTPRSLVSMAVLIGAIVMLSLGAESATTAAGHRPITAAQAAATILAACLSGFAYATCNVTIRRTVTGRASVAGTLLLLSGSGVVGLGLASWWRLGAEQLAATPLETAGTVLVAGICNAVAFFALGLALQRISIVRSNALNASQTALAAVLGVLLFDERLTMWLVLGAALTCLGLLLMDDSRNG